MTAPKRLSPEDMARLKARLENERVEAKDRSLVGSPWDPITAQRVANTMFDAEQAIAALEAEIEFKSRLLDEYIALYDSAANAADEARTREAKAIAHEREACAKESAEFIDFVLRHTYPERAEKHGPKVLHEMILYHPHVAAIRARKEASDE